MCCRKGKGEWMRNPLIQTVYLKAGTATGNCKTTHTEITKEFVICEACFVTQADSQSVEVFTIQYNTNAMQYST